jgi:GAF domain-containing protein
MRLLFVAASVKVAVGILASGLVLGAPSPAAPALPTLYYLALLLIFQLSAAWLFIGGRRDVRARALATLFVLFATLFTDRIVGRATAHAPDILDRAMLLVAAVQMVAFCPYAFWRFVYLFPRPQPAVGPRWIGPAMESATLLTAIVLVVGNLLATAPGAAHWGLASALAWTSPNDDRVFWQALTVLSLGCLSLLIVKWRSGTRIERRRLGWVVVGIVLGILPMLVHIVLAVTVPSYAAFVAQPESSRALGIILTLFTLVIPLTTTYAVVVDQALDVSLVVRRAVQYALAKYTVIAAIVGLVIAAAVVVYGNRTRPLSDVIAGSPLALSITFMLVALLASRRALLTALDRRFFRDHYDARQILVNLVERSQSLHSARDVTELLVAEVGRALHLERVALLMLDDSGDTLEDSQGRVRPLSLSGPLGSILSGSRAPLDVDLSSAGSALSRLPEPEREWLADAGARLVVPLFGVRDTPIGLLVLGDKRSELPFTQEDKRLMTAVAASAALALEQKISRESPDPETPASAPRGNAAQCASCGRVQPRSAQRCHTCSGPLRESLLPIVLAGKFEVEQQIGAGGMGVVYRARDLTLDRPVAMKVLPRLGAAAAARLRREARAMAALQHAHLAVIHVMESWRGAPVLVLEYLAGGTLADRIRHGPLPVNDVLTIFTAITEVLRHVHNAGYLHRDIKPSNLGFTFNGAPKLLDFGLLQLIADVSEGSTTASLTDGAMSLQRAADGEATHAGHSSDSSIRQFIGTPAYMSPEAIAMEPPGPLVDLWSLAVTMYESLTGTNPFRAPSMPETVKLVVLGNVPDARVLRADCPAPIAQFLATALSRNRHHRPQTAAEFLSALQAART